MPKAFSDAERDHIRSRLHEAGAQLFAKQGLRKTTIDEIVRAAGISKGAFYRFYDTKEALCLDVLETIEAGLRSRVLTEALVPRWGARAGVARRPRRRRPATERRADDLGRVPVVTILQPGRLRPPDPQASAREGRGARRQRSGLCQSLQCPAAS